jgi:hypothetical protein
MTILADNCVEDRTRINNTILSIIGTLEARTKRAEESAREPFFDNCPRLEREVVPYLTKIVWRTQSIECQGFLQ